MAVWQAIEAAVGHHAYHGKRRAFERVASGCRAVIYAALGYKAFSTVTGSAKSAAMGAYNSPAGRLVTGV